MKSASPQNNRWNKVLKSTLKCLGFFILSLGLIFHGVFRFLSGFDGSYTKKASGYVLDCPNEATMNHHVAKLLITHRNEVFVYGRSEHEGGFTITGPTIVVMSNGYVHVAHGVFILRSEKAVRPF